MSFMIIHVQATTMPDMRSCRVQVIYRRRVDGLVWRRDWIAPWRAEDNRVEPQAMFDAVEIFDLKADWDVISPREKPQLVHDGEHLIIPAKPAEGPYAHHIERATELLAREAEERGRVEGAASDDDASLGEHHDQVECWSCGADGSREPIVCPVKSHSEGAPVHCHCCQSCRIQCRPTS